MSIRQGIFYICLFFYFAFGLYSIFSIPGIISTVQAEVNSGSQDNCQSIYGGGESCVQTGNIIINKTVLNPQTLKYVDNLNEQDPKYIQDQIVQFQISVSNTSKNPIKNIEIKDLMPQYINKPKTIKFRIDNLNVNEIKIFTVKGKIASKIDPLSDNKVICLVNQALAAQRQQISQDNSRFCIQKEASLTSGQNNTKGGLPVYPPSKVKSTPATGPETSALLGLLASGLFGFILRKKG